MLAKLTRWSLGRPKLVAWSCIWLVACGVIFARDVKIAQLPDVAPVQAIVETQAPGLVSEQVEQLVTRPVESALAGTSGVAHVHSQSVQGLSVITLTFAPKAPPVDVRQALLENLTSLSGALPPGVEAPRLEPMTSGGGDVLKVGFTSGKLDPMALRDVVEWTVRPRLLAVSGVAQVTLYGGASRSIIVRARPGDLSDSDLGFLDVIDAVRRATAVSGAGFIDTPSQRIAIEPQGQALTADAIGAGQIQTAGSDPVRINDVTDISEGPAPQFGDALIDGQPGVLLSVSSQYGANPMALTHSVEQALALLHPVLQAQGVAVSSDIDRPTTFTSWNIRQVAIDLAISVVLIAAVLFIFMRDARAALISLASIPLSFLLAVVAVKAMGWSLNVMTLGGFAVALGPAIDDAVIDVENILARLRKAERRHSSYPKAILAASLEVRGPVIYATVALIVVVLPLLFLPGEPGELLGPLAGAIVAACVASLIVAAMVTPALALLALQHIGPKPQPHTSRIAEFHQRCLTRLNTAPRLTLLLAFAGVWCAIGVLALARPALLPTLHDDQIIVGISAPPATSLATMREYGTRISQDIRHLNGVKTIAMQIGRGAPQPDATGIESASFDVGLAPGLSATQQDAVAAKITDLLQAYPGLHPVVQSRFDANGAKSQVNAPFSVSIFGPDLDALDAVGAQIAGVLQGLPGGGAARVTDNARAPVVRVDLNFDKLAIYGLSAADVLDTVQAAFASEQVAKVYDGDRTVAVSVAAQDSLRRDPEAVGDLLLRSHSGFSVPLKSVANIYLTDGRATIAHDDGLRRQIVTADPSGKNSRAFGIEAQAAIAKQVKLPPDVFVEYKTADADARDATRSIVLNYAIAMFTIIAVLAVAFDSWAALLIVFSSLFSFVGAVIAVMLLGAALSVGPIIAFIALFGLSMRNAMLLISRLNDLVIAKQKPWSFALVARAARDRAGPLLMSSALIALGLAPFAVQAGAPGFEILGPMAIIIIGGLISGTLGGLFILPVLISSIWRPGPVSVHRAADETPARD